MDDLFKECFEAFDRQSESITNASESFNELTELLKDQTVKGWLDLLKDFQND